MAVGRGSGHAALTATQRTESKAAIGVDVGTVASTGVLAATYPAADYRGAIAWIGGARYVSDGTSWVLSPVSDGGTKTLGLFTPMVSQPPATNFATLDTRNSIAVLDFDDSIAENTRFVSFVPEGANLTSGITVNIYWMATTATSGNVRWGVQFERFGTDMDVDSWDTAAEAHSAANATSGIETVTSITITTIDALAAGERYRLRVYRAAADATNDTMAGDAELVGVELRRVA